MNLARKYQRLLGSNILDVEKVTINKHKDHHENIWWILKDGSAIGLDVNKVVYVKDKYIRA